MRRQWFTLQIYLFIIKSYTEYNKHIKEKKSKNEHREKNTEKLKVKNMHKFIKHTIKH